MKKAYRAPGIKEYGSVSEFTLGITGSVPDYSPTAGFVGPGCGTASFLVGTSTQFRNICLVSP